MVRSSRLIFAAGNGPPFNARSPELAPLPTDVVLYITSDARTNAPSHGIKGVRELRRHSARATSLCAPAVSAGAWGQPSLPGRLSRRQVGMSVAGCG